MIAAPVSSPPAARASGGRSSPARSEITKYAQTHTAAASANSVPSRSNDAPEMSTTSTRPTIATAEPHSTSADGAFRVRSHTNPTSMTGARYWISRATATGIRCMAEKKKSWQPRTGMSPNATISMPCRRRKPRWRRIARKRAGERMSPATPILTSSAAPSDHPASSSGLMNGPLEEKASADASARIRPDVLTRCVDRAPMTGSDAVGAAMAVSVDRELSGVKSVTLVTIAAAPVRSQHGLHS